MGSYVGISTISEKNPQRNFLSKFGWSAYNHLAKGQREGERVILQNFPTRHLFEKAAFSEISD